MIYCIGHNIISPLGMTSEENFEAVLAGKTGLKRHEGIFGLPEPCYVSVFRQDGDFRQDVQDLHDGQRDKSRLHDVFLSSLISNLSSLERLMIASIASANETANIDLAADDTLFIISTTKGNVAYLSDNEDNRIYLWHTAQRVSGYFGNKNEPLVVSNACISGAAAQVEALRLLNGNHFKNAVVVGGDLLSKFIISGFQSFKALSPECCKPFDKDRCGLNLGEAVATIIYVNEPSENSLFTLVNGAIRNDARHISAPSIEAEGLYNTLQETLQGVDLQDIAFINAHGTATVYNDEMEALALNRMQMQQTPVNSLKAFFGHTLGAAGVLETIISSMALRKGLILKSEGCDEADCKHEIHPAKKTMKTDKKSFVKMVSGFGGTNAALLVRQDNFFRQDEQDLQEKVLRQDEQDLQEKVLRQDEQDLQEKVLRQDEQDLQEKVLKQDEQDLQEKVLRQDEQDLQEKVLRQDEQDLQEKVLRQDEQDLQEKVLRQDEQDLQDGQRDKSRCDGYGTANAVLSTTLHIITYAIFNGKSLNINGKSVKIEHFGDNILTNIYKTAGIAYPKFFKMDNMSKVGFLVSELMLRDINFDFETPKKDVAIALFNRSSSSDDDLAYLQSINDVTNYFPSPSVFVYTLPNIVAGEIAIRNKFLGESSFYVTENISAKTIFRQVNAIMQSKSMNYVLCGWVECFKENIDVRMMLVGKGNSNEKLFNEENITQLWKI